MRSIDRALLLDIHFKRRKNEIIKRFNGNIQGKRLWFYISKKTKKKFYKEVKTMNLCFPNGKKVLPFRISDQMAISNQQIAYISCACWIRSKLDQNIIKIDYEKFLNNNHYIID